MAYQQGNINEDFGGAFLTHASISGHFPTDKALEKQAKAIVEHYHQNGMSLASLWTDADAAADPKHMNEGDEKYLQYIRLFAVQKIIDDLEEMKSEGALQPTQAGTHGMLGMLATDKARDDDVKGTAVSAQAQAVEDKSPKLHPKLNPKAEVFTPTARRATHTKRTPSTESVNITTTGAPSFEERCQKLGLRVSPAPPKKPAKSIINSTLNPAALSFEERCKMIGLRISPQKH